MRDFAYHADPNVQRQLDRLSALSLPRGRLGLDTVRALLARLGYPHERLPPVLHIAGTNGKGSVCAFLTAILEADRQRVHRTTSPHLVRYNERILLAGEEIGDAALAELLEEVLDAAEDLSPSFFEATIAAAFLAFTRIPADACVVEVGLGGRFDATNVLPSPAACGIAALGIDHAQFLLAPEDGVPQAPLARIAFEKAGIVKPGVPVVTLSYPEEAVLEIERAAMAAGAPLAMAGREWHWSATTTGLHYADRHGELALPRPALEGEHQLANAALAIAMLRHQDRVTATRDAIAQGLRTATWPGRLQRLDHSTRAVWLDGGHNPLAGQALARRFAGERLHLVIGMLANKDAAGFIGSLRDIAATVTIVPVPGHDAHPATAFDEMRAAGTVDEALSALPDDGLPVLVTGSLYLVGEVLRSQR